MKNKEDEREETRMLLLFFWVLLQLHSVCLNEHLLIF